tara:strand:- start:1194 stop:1532 length:339 start_codon:yes stop_codon:yes gene_type:complete
MTTNIIVDEILTALTKVKDFKLTYKKLYSLLNKSNFHEKIEELEEKMNISPYKIFILEQLDKGVELKNVLNLWDKIRKNPKELDIYQKKYNKQIIKLKAGAYDYNNRNIYDV